MDKRLKKKADKARRREIHALLDVILDINGLSKRRRDITGELPTAFFKFSGHTADIEIEIHNKGWFPFRDWDYFEEIDVNTEKVGHEILRLKERYGN